MDLKEFPEEILPSYGVSEEELDAFYGKGTGVVCQMKHSNAFVMSQNHGQSKFIQSKFM